MALLWQAVVLFLHSVLLINYVSTDSNSSNGDYFDEIRSVLYYLNDVPDRNVTFNHAYLINAQKTPSSILDIFLEVHAVCLDQTVCESKIFTCRAYVQCFQYPEKKFETLQAGCMPYFEPIAKPEQVNPLDYVKNSNENPIKFDTFVPIQKTLDYETIEEVTATSDLVQNSNEKTEYDTLEPTRKTLNNELKKSEETSSEGVVDDFISKKTASCTGCLYDLNVMVPGINTLIDTALNHINSEKKQKHVYLNTFRVQQQVVAGIKYYILLQVAPTVCDNDVKNVEKCPVDQTLSPLLCHVEFLEQSWISKDINIISNNCTETQEFAASRRYLGRNDLDNEIDVNNDYQKTDKPKNIPTHEEMIDGSPNFDKIAETGVFEEPDMTLTRLLDLESQIIPTHSTDSVKFKPALVETTKSGVDNSQLGVEDIPSFQSSTDSFKPLSNEQVTEESKMSNLNDDFIITELGLMHQQEDLFPKVDLVNDETKIIQDTRDNSEDKISNVSDEYQGEPSSRKKRAVSSESNSNESSEEKKKEEPIASEVIAPKTKRSISLKSKKDQSSEESNESSEEVKTVVPQNHEVSPKIKRDVSSEESDEIDEEMSAKNIDAEESENYSLHQQDSRIKRSLTKDDDSSSSEEDQNKKDIEKKDLHQTTADHEINTINNVTDPNLKVNDDSSSSSSEDEDTKKLRVRRCTDDNSSSSSSSEEDDNKNDKHKKKASDVETKKGDCKIAHDKNDEVNGDKNKKDDSSSSSSSSDDEKRVKRDADSSSSSSSSSDDDDDNNGDDDDNKGNDVKKCDKKCEYKKQHTNDLKKRKSKQDDVKKDSSSSSSSSSSDDNDDDNNRKRRQLEITNQSDGKVINELAAYAANWLDIRSQIHTVKEILKSEKQELEGTLYYLTLLLSVECSPPNTHNCVNEDKKCKVQIHIGKDNKKRLLKYNCFNTNNELIKSHDTRERRQIPGGPSDAKNDPDIKALAKAALLRLDSESNHPNIYKVVEIVEATRQVVSGVLYRIKAKIVLSNCPKGNDQDSDLCSELKEATPKICDVKIWEQSWLKKKETNITCDSGENHYFRNRRSLEFNPEEQRHNKRQVLGGVSDAKDSEYINELANLALVRLDSESSHQNKHKIIEIIKASTQVVSGALYKIKLRVVISDCPKSSDKDPHLCGALKEATPKICDVKIWEQKWLNKKETNVTCDSGEKHYFRNRRSASYVLSKSEQKHIWLFDQFMVAHNKVYKNIAEKLHRFKIFKENLEKINVLNGNEQGTARYGTTKFADLSTKEFKQFTGYRPDLRNENNIEFAKATIPNIDLPTEFDWRQKGAVAEVKNQGSCGSCWAFSVTGNIEGQYAIKNGKLLEFSEQELVDCDKTDDGCNGGLMDNAYRVIEQMGGLELESDYPYDARDDQCSFNKSMSRVQLTGALNISQDETEMAKWLVKNGPISIAINANAMQFYMGGVSHPYKFLCSPKNLDHGVLIVGYGVHKYPLFNKTLPYWIVKNSWGPSWGEQGYYRVYRGDGTCGVNQTPSSAIVE